MEKNNALTIVLGIIILVVLLTFFMILKNENTKKYIANSNTTEINQNTTQNTDPKSKEDIYKGDNMAEVNFATEFLKLENNSKNMVYSPLSIKYALKMLLEGADGNTKKEIEDLVKDFNISKYKNIDKILSLANVAYIRADFSSNIKKNFTDELKKKYDAEVKYDEFSSADNINSWIEEKTFGKIKNMISDKMVTDPNNKMILVNALAIDMEWKEKFERDDTYERPFYKIDGTEIEATTMNKNFKSENASYYKDDNITVLTMDLQEYGETTFEFVAIMPEENLSEYINNFDASKLAKIDDELVLASKTKNKKGIDVSIPKFKFDYDLSLKNDLISLGMIDAFDMGKANFSKIVDADEFYVSDALHKADIEFSEDGIKASAATAIFMTMGAMFEEEQPIDITIDKPFLYIIRDKSTKEIWFMGTVYEPNLWEKDKGDYSREY